MNSGEVAELYSAYADALVRFAASQVGWSDADDVVSAAVIGVVRTDLAGIDEPTAYLYRSVANACRKHWRTLDRRTRREGAWAAALAADTGEPHDLELGPVIDALSLLSVQQRAVVHLTYWEDLTPGEVAHRLGVSDGTVRRQLARARERLRGVLDDER